MLLGNYFRICAATIIILMIVQKGFAEIEEKKCGPYFFKVRIEAESGEYKDNKFWFYYRKEDTEFKLFYKQFHMDSMRASCIQDSKNRYLLGIKEVIWGVVPPEDIYGVYDPEKGKFLISPDRWRDTGNSKEVSKIVGYPVDSTTFDKAEFCCYMYKYIKTLQS